MDKYLVLADPDVVGIIQAGADDVPADIMVIGPGQASCGSRYMFDQLIIQPGWQPTDLEREWVRVTVLTRFGPDDIEAALAAAAPFMPRDEVFHCG